MLTSRKQPTTIERNVWRNGRLFCVRAEVIDIDGRTYARVIGVHEIREIAGFKKTAPSKLCLCGDTTAVLETQTPYRDTPTVSPYFNFDFFTSQMTRAPAFI